MKAWMIEANEMEDRTGQFFPVKLLYFEKYDGFRMCHNNSNGYDYTWITRTNDHYDFKLFQQRFEKNFAKFHHCPVLSIMTGECAFQNKLSMSLLSPQS